MSGSVLVTGATGFIGKHVVSALSARGIECVAMSRNAPAATEPSVRWVVGDICDAPELPNALDGVDRVIHLAAATGAADDEEMHRVNVDGTAAMLEAATRARVGRFVHVSTIAVTYPDLSDYPYGRSKVEAESFVVGSDLAWTVVRPTIVLGPQAPALGPFRSLAGGPVMLAPGGGRVTVQPIDVRDVAEALVLWSLADDTVGDIVALGGRETLTMRDLLAQVRKAAGKTPGVVIPLPLGPLRLVARIATAVLGGRTPVTPGQLSAFRFDSVAGELDPKLGFAPRHTIAEMLAR